MPSEPHDPWKDWTPTPANLNALPDPVRRYIHDLETRCDPAGEVRALTLARDTVCALEMEVARLRTALQRYGQHKGSCGILKCARVFQGERCGLWEHDPDVHAGAAADSHMFVGGRCTCGFAAALWPQDAEQETR